MKNDSWDSVFYTKEEFHRLYTITGGFNEDAITNHRVRQESESFSTFMDKAIATMISDHPDLVKKLK